MAKLRHVAITVDDLDKESEFYQNTFELEEISRAGTSEMGAIYLSDGTINIALIKIPDENHPNYAPPGINHIGFVVDDMDGAIARAQKYGNKCMVDPNDRDAGVTWEMKMQTPSGVDFDFSEHGWPGITL